MLQVMWTERMILLIDLLLKIYSLRLIQMAANLLWIYMRLWHTVAVPQKIEKVLFFRTVPVCHTLMHQTHIVWMSLLIKNGLTRFCCSCCSHWCCFSSCCSHWCCFSNCRSHWCCFSSCCCPGPRGANNNSFESNWDQFWCHICSSKYDLVAKRQRGSLVLNSVIVLLTKMFFEIPFAASNEIGMVRNQYL